MSNDTKVRLRDQRKPGHGWFDNEIFDVFGDELGHTGISVYVTLTRLCYGTSVKMSLREMGAQARMNKDTLSRALRTVIALGLVIERKGATPQSASTYELVDVKELAQKYLREAVESEKLAVEEKRRSFASSVSQRDTSPMPTLVELLSPRAGSGSAAPSVVQSRDCLTGRQIGGDVEIGGGETGVSQSEGRFETEVSLQQDTFNKTQDTRLTTTPQPPLHGGVPGSSREASRAARSAPGDANGVACGSCAAADAAVAKVMRECNLSNARLARVIRAQLELARSQRNAPVEEWDASAMRMVGRIRLYRADTELLRFTVGMRKFLEDGLWLNVDAWPYDQKLLDRMRNARIGCA